MTKHPVVRKVMNIERMNALEIRRKAGKAPPKKGQGKRALKGKK